MQSKGVWVHLDGTTPHPGTSPVVPLAAGSADREVEQPSATPIMEAALLATWQKDEALTHDLLTQWIPDSTVLVIHTANQSTAAVMWTEIIHEYTQKGSYTQTDLRTKFLESKCLDKGDVHAWLDSLHVQKEELAQVGVDIIQTWWSWPLLYMACMSPIYFGKNTSKLFLYVNWLKMHPHNHNEEEMSSQTE